MSNSPLDKSFDMEGPRSPRGFRRLVLLMHLGNLPVLNRLFRHDPLGEMEELPEFGSPKARLGGLLKGEHFEFTGDLPLVERPKPRFGFKTWFRRRHLETMTEASDPAELLYLATYKRRRRLTMLAASPAVLMVIAIGGVLYRAQSAQSAIKGEYRSAGREAFVAGNLDQAKFYYSRLIGDGDLGSPQDELNWASMLASSGDSQAALKLLDKLAPEAAVGFGPAHRQKAIMLMGIIQSGKSQGTDALERLQWHLRQGVRDESIESHQLWTVYYLATGQVDKAIAKQTLAAQLNPDLWLNVASLCAPAERAEDRTRFLARAESHARQSLEANPLDTRRRLMLARVLVDRGEFDSAEKILLDGFKLQNAPEVKRACSDFYLVRLARLPAVPGGNDELTQLREKIRLIDQASRFDPSNPAVFQYWAAIHEELDSDQHKQQVREQLEKSIVEGDSAAFAHFTLGGILWKADEREKSLFHMEKAFELDPRFMEAANNLAWVLATQEKPDLERADRLIRQALSQRPNDIRYQDTLGEVLARQGKWDEALVVLEKVLPFVAKSQRKDLHRRLAEAYENLGQENLAKLHRESAEAI